MNSLPTRVLGFRPLAYSSIYLSDFVPNVPAPKRSERRLGSTVATLFVFLLLLGAPVLCHAQYEVLYSFCAQNALNCTSGANPSGLVRDSSGNLYGTTSNGGTHGSNANSGGTVFKLDSTGLQTVLYNFCSAANCTDGSFPVGLIRDPTGTYMGPHPMAALSMGARCSRWTARDRKPSCTVSVCKPIVRTPALMDPPPVEV